MAAPQRAMGKHKRRAARASWRAQRDTSVCNRAMGLHASGENGVKAVIKSRFRAAARTYESLGDMRTATKTPRAQVALALDGNV